MTPATERVKSALGAEIPEVASGDYHRSWERLGIDSFGLLALRAALEQALGFELKDADWLETRCPQDALRLAEGAHPTRGVEAEPRPHFHESIEIGMPQMAMSGLSESWLFKTLGDVHWRVLAQAVATKPVDMRDSLGNRLYATFARIRFVSSQPLARFEEGDRLDLSACLSRLGGGLFFSDIQVRSERGGSIAAELMSTFAYRGARGNNDDLVRSQVELPADCAATALAEMPAFGIGYQEKRRDRAEPRPALKREPYEILPQHDINGVGLLYFAAYPIIADICEMRAQGGARWSDATSIVERDVCYFANAAPDRKLEWRLLRDEHGDGLATEASIVREDNEVIGAIKTRKVQL